jgi:hypothetical protein
MGKQAYRLADRAQGGHSGRSFDKSLLQKGFS